MDELFDDSEQEVDEMDSLFTGILPSKLSVIEQDEGEDYD